MIDIQWDCKFALGHKKIDFEHQIFLELLKSVSDLPADSEKIPRTLQEVEKYAEFHFLSEENLMIDINYSRLAEHEQEHKRLLAALQDNVHKLNDGVINLEDVIEFLFEWFALHTTRCDAELAKYINNRDSL
ncbi:MAG: hemerythrin family protein [Motiliproteus sp.]|nr:hemerythrin family protein [Motiliproteus sp.]MCW9051400.1 hemerythrin family protein [Motiliproteus sp.]